MEVTRLAPSPTGALHLGNARTFLINWLLARQGGWNIVLRIEDLDGPRVKRGADKQAIDDLQWLGIDWDEGPVYQSTRTAMYRAAIDRLVELKLAYPCICSRREVELAASAPHADDGATIYPGTCRGKFESVEDARRAAGHEPAIRFRVDNQVVEFFDQLRGPQSFRLADLGDFVIEKADRTPAYQLAIVVDDAAMNVSNVVRGDDLLDSTPRQLMLYRAMGLSDRIPDYLHVPLVVGPDGRRLAKRHGDTRLAHYREHGVPASRLVQLLGRWCGMSEVAHFGTARDLLDSFSLDALPKEPIVFDPADL